MTGVIATIPRYQFSSSTGAPLALGTLTVYLANTTTPTDTWQDSALSTLNTNPVQLDSSGSCVLWLDSTKSYKFVLKNAAGATQWTQDNISGADAHLRGDLAASSGSSLVGYLPAGTGAVASTVQGKLRESVSVKDFGAVGDGVTDDTAAIQAAITAVENTGGILDLPPGAFKITSALSITGASAIWIRGTWASIISNAGTGKAIAVGNTGADQTNDVRLLGFQIVGNASSSHGIHMMRMHNVLIEGVRSRNNGGDGIRMEGCYAARVVRNYSNNNTGNGIYAVATAAAGNDFILITMNACLANGGKGIFVDNAIYGPAGQRVELNDLEGNAIGFQLNVGSASNTEQFTFRGNYMENNTGANAVFANDGGTAVLNSPWIESNAFMFGSVSAAANCVTIGAKARQVNLVGNNFVTSDLTFNNSATLGIVGGNKSNATMPGGFDSGGGMTVSQLRLWQPGGGAYSAIAMIGGLINVNYPMQTGGEFYPASANTAAAQAVCGIWAGTGAPNNSYGASGHVYFRSDTPGTANQRVYVKNGGAWVGVL